MRFEPVYGIKLLCPSDSTPVWEGEGRLVAVKASASHMLDKHSVIEL